MKIRKHIYITLLACLTFWSAYGQLSDSRQWPAQTSIDQLQLQNEVFYPAGIFSTPVNQIEEGIGPYVSLKMDDRGLKELFNANYKSIQLKIPQPGGTTVNVLLTQHQIHAEDFEFSITDASGKHPVTMNKGRYYYGVVEGKPSSLVAISIFEDEISGVISDESGNWNLGRRKNNQEEYVFFNDQTFRLPIQFKCETADNDQQQHKGIQNNLNTFGTQFKGNCAKIFFDCAYTYYQTAGNSTTNVTNHTNSIFNVMTTIYGNDSISLAIGSIHIWTVADPFDYTSNGTALNTFQTYYNTNGYTGNIAALLSTQDTLGGGVAYVNSICGPFSYGFNRINYGSISGFPTYTWDVFLVSHESGHTLGSPHTHWCDWTGGPIDGCNTCFGIGTDGGCASSSVIPATGGTIMSYCHGCAVGINFTNGFGFQPSSKIRDAIAAASCITVCTSCNTNLALSGGHMTGSSTSWWATNEIVGSFINQQPNSYLNFNAGVSVRLLPDVEILAGSTFHASVGCAPIAIAASPGLNSSPYTSTLKKAGSGNELVVYPNPFKDQVKAAFDLTDAASVSISVYDQVGKIVFTVFSNRVLGNGRREEMINTESLEEGIYYLVVQINEERITRKLIKL